MTICIVDTSVFCEILDVPGKTQHRDVVLEELEKRISDEVLLLPIAVVLETGNHIGHLSQGELRRDAAERFRDQVSKALKGDTPFSPTPIQDAKKLLGWLKEFPDHATRGLSFCDLSIIKIWEEQCRMCPGHRVYIWSMDGHLSGYDRTV